MTGKRIANLTVALHDMQSSLARSLAISMRALALASRNGMTTVSRSAECSPTDSLLEDSVAKDEDQKVVKEGFTMFLLDVHHPCNAMHQP